MHQIIDFDHECNDVYLTITDENLKNLVNCQENNQINKCGNCSQEYTFVSENQWNMLEDLSTINKFKICIIQKLEFIINDYPETYCIKIKINDEKIKAFIWYKNKKY